MTVGELRQRLAPFTDECVVLIDGLNMNGVGQTFSEIDSEYRYVNGYGFVVLNYDASEEREC